MKISLKYIYKTFFFIGIFFIPFNSYQGISFLGEYRKEAAIVFFILSIVFFFLEVFFKRKIKFPFKNIFFQFLIVFVLWIFISAAFNMPAIFGNYMKQTSGVNRLIRQVISISISLLFFVVTYNIVSKYTLKEVFFKVRKIFFLSFVFVCFYSFFEILILKFNFIFLKEVFKLFNYFPFLETNLDFTHKRISSVSHEPPFLAIYLISVAGWMFSYILTSKRKTKFIPMLLIFGLTFFSGSRTALIVILIQFFAFIFVSITVNKRFFKLILGLFVFLFFSFSIVYTLNYEKVSKEIKSKIETLNFKKNLSKSVSNKSRLGMQYTSLLIFKDNPIFGVGFGQQAYTGRYLYPKWATNKNWEFKYYYLNEKEKSFPPGFNIYTRLLAETGIVGFLIFIFFLFLIVQQTLKNKKSTNANKKVIAITLYTSFVGFIINWLQFDSFRVFGFWICLSILILQTKYIKVNDQNSCFNTSL